MNPWIGAFLAVATPLILGCPAMVLAHPCPEPDCTNTESCESSADWVVEGTVVDVVEGARHQECETAPYGPWCGTTEDAPRLTLKDVRQLRGKLDLVDRRLTIVRASSCFSGFLSSAAADVSPYIDKESIGRRFRFYGFQSFHGPFMSPGFIIATPLKGGY